MKLESVDLNLLLVFDALATERHVTRAALKIGLSQPALSNALARLRKLFSDPLFVRVGGKMQPTPRAQRLLPPLSEAISTLRDALETKVRFQPEASEREFRVATNDHVEALLLPPLVRRLRRQAPSAAVRTVRTEYLFIPPAEELQMGEIDVALGFFAEIQEPDSGLLTHRLSAERLVCILRASHPRASRRLSLQAFAGIPHARIMYPRREHFGIIDPILSSYGLARRIAVTVPHYSAIPPVVAQSDLLGVVPESLGRQVARQLRLKVLDPPVALPDIGTVMAWHERLRFDPAHIWFRECIIAAWAKRPRVPSLSFRPKPPAAPKRSAKVEGISQLRNSRQ